MMSLDEENFYGLVVDSDSLQVISYEPWFIKFFAPWCPHCQHLAPTWEEFHHEYKDKLNVAEVDCTTYSGYSLCHAFGITGYPTMLYLPARGNYFYRYASSARTVEAFADFALNDGWREEPGKKIKAPAESIFSSVNEVATSVME